MLITPSTWLPNYSGGYFITGTDTNAGKTFVTALLTRQLRKQGLNTVAIKPIACGSLEDSETLAAAADHELSMGEITPVYYTAPLAPLDAAPQEGRFFSPEQVLLPLTELRKKRSSILVEGVGGWLAPLSENYFIADLAYAIGFPIILVIRNRLGAFNHALLTLESIKNHGLTCAGIILNHHPDDEGDLAIDGYRRHFKNLSKKSNFSLFFEVASWQAELDI